jgi:hypothetical protein
METNVLAAYIEGNTLSSTIFENRHLVDMYEKGKTTLGNSEYRTKNFDQLA